MFPGQIDMVLLDLRNYSKSNQGSIREFPHLMNSIQLDRVVFAIDDSTDRAFLEMTIREIWQELSSTSPNAKLFRPVVRCYAIKQQSPAEIEQLLFMLLGAQTVTA